LLNGLFFFPVAFASSESSSGGAAEGPEGISGRRTGEFGPSSIPLVGGNFGVGLLAFFFREGFFDTIVMPLRFGFLSSPPASPPLSPALPASAFGSAAFDFFEPPPDFAPAFSAEAFSAGPLVSAAPPDFFVVAFFSEAFEAAFFEPAGAAFFVAGFFETDALPAVFFALAFFDPAFEVDFFAAPDDAAFCAAAFFVVFFAAGFFAVFFDEPPPAPPAPPDPDPDFVVFFADFFAPEPPDFVPRPLLLDVVFALANSSPRTTVLRTKAKQNAGPVEWCERYPDPPAESKETGSPPDPKRFSGPYPRLEYHQNR
jgi:hypothetical protein